MEEAHQWHSRRSTLTSGMEPEMQSFILCTVLTESKLTPRKGQRAILGLPSQSAHSPSLNTGSPGCLEIHWSNKF